MWNIIQIVGVGRRKKIEENNKKCCLSKPCAAPRGLGYAPLEVPELLPQGPCTAPPGPKAPLLEVPWRCLLRSQVRRHPNFWDQNVQV